MKSFTHAQLEVLCRLAEQHLQGDMSPRDRAVLLNAVTKLEDGLRGREHQMQRRAKKTVEPVQP